MLNSEVYKKMRINIRKMTVVTVIALLLAGCGQTKQLDEEVVDNVVEETTVDEETVDEETAADEENIVEEQAEEESEEEVLFPNYGKETESESETEETVDYDLTQMNKDMIYATIYQLMVDPYTYVGKRYKIEGDFYRAYDEDTGAEYNYCIVRDAMACCAQGLEFLCDEDLPEDGTSLTVEGNFETYTENGILYCRLYDTIVTQN